MARVDGPPAGADQGTAAELEGHPVPVRVGHRPHRDCSRLGARAHRASSAGDAAGTVDTGTGRAVACAPDPHGVGNAVTPPGIARVIGIIAITFAVMVATSYVSQAYAMEPVFFDFSSIILVGTFVSSCVAWIVLMPHLGGSRASARVGLSGALGCLTSVACAVALTFVLLADHG